MIKENITRIRERVEQACGRSGRAASSVTIVAVTKGASCDQIREAAGCGLTDIGENRVREALEKRRELGSAGLRWHMVGHLQTNKARDAVAVFDCIHSLDSLHCAEALDAQAKAAGKRLEAFLEVNISGEQSKYGIVPGETLETVRSIRSLDGLLLKGLMTMAPVSRTQDEPRRVFRALRTLRDELESALGTPGGLPDLSMGMTGDFETAIEEGATMIRIGRGIFGQAI